MKIRIIDIPPGFAPAWVRKEWLNIELPTTGLSKEGKESFIAGSENVGGYEVKGYDAIAALYQAKKINAARYWIPFYYDILVFKKECCELIEE